MTTKHEIELHKRIVIYFKKYKFMSVNHYNSIKRDVDKKYLSDGD